MDKSEHKRFVELINKIESPYQCDSWIALLEARREQLGPDSEGYKPKQTIP